MDQNTRHCCYDSSELANLNLNKTGVIIHLYHFTFFSNTCQNLLVQKQPPRGVPTKSCSEIMQQIYRRAPMPKCTCKFSPVNLLHIFSTPFLKNTSGQLSLLFVFGIFYSLPKSLDQKYNILNFSVITSTIHDVLNENKYQDNTFQSTYLSVDQ